MKMKKIFASTSTKLSSLLCIFICCSSVFISYSALGAESGKKLYDTILALDWKSSYDDTLAWDKAAETGDFFSAMFRMGGKEMIESFTLQKQLKELAVSGDPEAAFWWGFYNFAKGREAARYSEKLNQDMASDKFKEAYFGYKIASNAGVSEASWNIAIMYEQGYGVILSKLAAAEWYYKAGQQHLKSGNRESALAALERIENIDSKLSDAIKLRSALYTPAKHK